jgi:predicted alpha/beta hydrolase
VASRPDEGEEPPEVEVAGRVGSGGSRSSRRGLDEGLLVMREVMVGHVLGGLRGELVRELVGLGAM